MTDPIQPVAIRPNPPSWFEQPAGKWQRLSLGARLNLAFSRLHDRHHIATKEWWENREFFAKVQPWMEWYFGGGAVELVLDVGGGHGLQSLLWLAFGAARRALIVDRHQPLIHARLIDAFREVVDVEPPAYCETHWQDFEPPPLPLRTVILGVHACGIFGERLMAWAQEQERPFAVLTCCHETPDDLFVARLKELAREKGISYFDALDLVRLGRIEGWGWKGWMETLSPSITPRNNILLGFPPHRRTPFARRESEGT